MKITKMLTTTLIMCYTFFLSFSQENNYSTNEFFWLEMMQKSNANFFDIQKEFRKKSSLISNEQLIKQYKRWEWYWEPRINSDGTFPQYNKTVSEFIKYFSKKRNNFGNWENLGPSYAPYHETGSGQGIGRVNFFISHPTNSLIAYIGTPSGGLWKTENLLYIPTKWKPLTDFLPHLGVSAIAINYQNPDIMYIGTGDKDAGGMQGIGILKSTDAGQTWFFINNDSEQILKNQTVSELLIHPNNPNVLFAVTGIGLYKTSDGGVTWRKTYNVFEGDLKMHPTNPNVLYYTGGGFHKSTDGGETWVKKHTIDGRIEIGVTQVNPNIVYLLSTNGVSFKGLYFSDDAGETFLLQSNTPNILGRYDGVDFDANTGQGHYDLALYINPNNANEVYVGGINLWFSDNKGITWERKTHWSKPVGQYTYMHADQHYMTEVSGGPF